MKVYVRDKSGHPVRDKGYGYEFVEISPCDKCREFRWSDEEKEAIKKSVELVYELAHFNFSLWVEHGGSFGSSDMRYERLLGHLIDPIRDPVDYDSHLIELLRGVVRLVAFSGVTDIKIEALLGINEKIRDLIGHLHNCHRENKLLDADPPFHDAPHEENVPIAYAHWFHTDYPLWLSLDELLNFLPNIRGKSQKEVYDYLEKKWNELPRCKTCKHILGFYDEESDDGLCYGCKSPAANVDIM